MCGMRIHTSARAEGETGFPASNDGSRDTLRAVLQRPHEPQGSDENTTRLFQHSPLMGRRGCFCGERMSLIWAAYNPSKRILFCVACGAEKEAV